jgi:penicillin V acylase-like amidase (Ntn superfamily)
MKKGDITMKKSIVSGKYVTDEINKMRSEHDELNEALHNLEKDSVPFRIIRDARDRKKEELHTEENIEYVRATIADNILR